MQTQILNLHNGVHRFVSSKPVKLSFVDPSDGTAHYVDTLQPGRGSFKLHSNYAVRLDYEDNTDLVVIPAPVYEDHLDSTSATAGQPRPRTLEEMIAHYTHLSAIRVAQSLQKQREEYDTPEEAEDFGDGDTDMSEFDDPLDHIHGKGYVVMPDLSGGEQGSPALQAPSGAVPTAPVSQSSSSPPGDSQASKPPAS